MSRITQEDIDLMSQGLVDSRVRETAGHPKKTFTGENWEPVYCVFCQKQDGWVTMESSEYARIHHCLRVCDECYEQVGVPPMKEVPKEFIHYTKAKA